MTKARIQTHTLIIFNTYCPSIVIMFTQKRLGQRVEAYYFATVSWICCHFILEQGEWILFFFWKFAVHLRSLISEFYCWTLCKINTPLFSIHNEFSLQWKHALSRISYQLCLSSNERDFVRFLKISWRTS